MKISLVGDMIDVSPEELEAIEYVTGTTPTRAIVVKYIQESYQRRVYLDLTEYRSETRQAKAASLRVEGNALLKQADALDAPKLPTPEDQ